MDYRLALWVIGFAGLLFPSTSHYAVFLLCSLALFNPDEAYYALIAALPIKLVGYLYIPQFSINFILASIVAGHLIIRSRANGSSPGIPFERGLWFFLFILVLSSFQSYAIPLTAPIVDNAIHNLPWAKSISRLILLFVMVGVAYATPQVVNSKERMRTLLVILSLTSGILGAYSIGSYVSGFYDIPTHIGDWRPVYKDGQMYPRVRGFEDEPLTYASYLLFVLFVLAGAVASGNWKKYTPLFVVALLINFIALVLTYSRSGMLAFAVGSIILLAFSIKQIPRRLLLFASAIFVFTLVLNSHLVLSVISSFTSAIDPTSVAYGSTSTRVNMIQWGLLTWMRHPILGVGYENFNFYSDYEYYDGISDYPINWPEVNSLPIKILAEAGILGLGAFLFFVSSLFYQLYQRIKERDLFSTGLFAALAANGVQLLFYSTLSRPHLWVLVGLIAISVNGYAQPLLRKY